MKKETFYSGLTSVLCLDPGEKVPEHEYGIVFSEGLLSPSVVVTTTPETYREFIASPAQDRAEIIQDVYERYLP